MEPSHYHGHAHPTELKWPDQNNCRATRVTELIKVYGKTQHSVCNWIGHTKAIEDEHYLMTVSYTHLTLPTIYSV